MSRDDYDDDDRPRRRKRRDDDYDDDVGRAPRSSSGSVTSVGVISIILGSLTLLCGLCGAVGSLTFMGAAGGGGPGQGFVPFQMAAGVMIIFAIIILVLGVLYLMGGIGVVQRRNWGRVMTLVMAGFSGIFGILSLIAVIAIFAAPGNPAEAKVMGALIYLLSAAIYFTHCIMSFVVLLNGRNASEFQ